MFRTPLAFLDVVRHCQATFDIAFDLTLFQQNGPEFLVILTRLGDVAGRSPVPRMSGEPSGGAGSVPSGCASAANLEVELRRVRAALQAREALLEDREQQLAENTELVRTMIASRSWRVTRPLREGTRMLRELTGRGGNPYRRGLEAMFDPDWYARVYDRPGSPTALLDEYLSTGWREGRNPTPLLDGDWYAAAYPRPGSERSPLEDYVSRPYDRRPNRWFDPTIWRRLPGRPGGDVVAYLAGIDVPDDPRHHGLEHDLQLATLPGTLRSRTAARCASTSTTTQTVASIPT